MARLRVMVRTHEATEPRLGSKTGAWRHTRTMASWATSSATPGVAGHGIGQAEDPALVAAHERDGGRLALPWPCRPGGPRRTARPWPRVILSSWVYGRTAPGFTPAGQSRRPRSPSVPPRRPRHPPPQIRPRPPGSSPAGAATSGAPRAGPASLLPVGRGPGSGPVGPRPVSARPSAKPAKRSSSGSGAPVVSKTRTKLSDAHDCENSSSPISRKKMLSLWLACAASEAYLRPATGAAVDRRRDQLVGRPEVGVLLDLRRAARSPPRPVLAEPADQRDAASRCSTASPGSPHSSSARMRDPVGLDVVGMAVEAVLVVGDDHLRAGTVRMRSASRPAGLGDRRPPEAVRARRSAASPPCPSRGTRAARDATRRGPRSSPRAPARAAGRRPTRRARVAGLHPAGRVAELAVGARDQHRPHAFVGVAGQDPAGPDGFVVGMGVHRHEGEGALGHGWQRRGRLCRFGVTSGGRPPRRPAARARPASPRAAPSAAR